MPAACEEFTAEELAYALAEHRGRAEDLLTLAAALEDQAARHQGGAAGRDHPAGQGADHRLRHRAARPRRGPAAEAMVLGRAGG